MIQMQTSLEVADNTGAKKLTCIKVLGGAKRRFAFPGDIIVVSVTDAIPRSKIKKGSVHKAMIVRSKFGMKRKDGTIIKADTNAAVLVKDGNPIGTRIFGCVFKEVRARSSKIVSLAPEVY